MAKKGQLRDTRSGTVINATSRTQEREVIIAMRGVEVHLKAKFGTNLCLKHSTHWLLQDIVKDLTTCFPEAEFHNHFDNTSIRPDGGILSLKSHSDSSKSFPILIAEVKNQGTNDLRLAEGKKLQAKGNAIERLGKNVIGLRTALMRETIFPFVCFGYGCDFEPTSSILDRVTTIAQFGKLNTIHLHDEIGGRLARGSFYFRSEAWTPGEMRDVMIDISERAVQYYFSKYGQSHFFKPSVGPEAQGSSGQIS